MTIEVIITWHNAGPHTIWAKLAEKLGREPTQQEAADEVRRILRDAREDDLDRRGITQEQRPRLHSHGARAMPRDNLSGEAS
jgi:hypothetical protein